MLPMNFCRISARLLAFVTATAAVQLPYNPTRVMVNSNGTFAYLFAPSPSSAQFSLSLIDTSTTFGPSNQSLTTLSASLPFLSAGSRDAFIPIATGEDHINVLAGDCTKAAQGLELWRFVLNEDQRSGTWSNLQLTLYDSTLAADFLSAGFSFSSTTSDNDTQLYIFGGMCPQTQSASATDWTEDATYSNTMLTISPESGNTGPSTPYELSLTGQRSPPIAEAGLSITPLVPSYTDTSTGNSPKQQNFVLIGGHTSDAFINMSQIALFSLPEQSWAFLNVDQPLTGATADLVLRDEAQVEPRSGHTALLTPDGAKIIVFGGWVGDVNTPASPQLAILEVGQGYGGTGDWEWSIPPQVSSPFAAGQGIYGHGASMLPGGVMMVSGGYRITGSGTSSKRDVSDQLLFFNTSSASWIDSYINPNWASSKSSNDNSSTSSSGLKSEAQKVGVGFGLGVGALAVAAVLLFWYIYRRRLAKQRAVREKELRELALGSERYHSNSVIGTAGEAGSRFPEMRSASWGNRQEQMMESNGEYPWAPVMSQHEAGQMGLEPGEDRYGNGLRQAERTGLLMELPSPTRGLRRSLHSRGPMGYGANFGPLGSGAPSVFRIDEEEENSQTGSLRRAKSPAGENSSRVSDPFKDPPGQPAQDSRPNTAAEERAKEVQAWVEDWRAAEETILSRNVSKATTPGRTHSSLSQSKSNSHSAGTQSGRGSPEKSDRTGSNLSERSMMSTFSIQRSQIGTITRNISQRSSSAGYALFAGAAAAMAARIRGESAKPVEYGTVSPEKADLARVPSKRSASLNLNSTSSSQGYLRERTETFSSARSSMGPIGPGEDHLLIRPSSRAVTDDREAWATPPESPVKKSYRQNSFGSQAGRTALGILGSVRRVFTGTANVDVKDRVAALEGRSEQSSPDKDLEPEMTESSRRTLSAGAAFWQGKQGARDWDATDPGVGSSTTIRRKPVPGQPLAPALIDDEDWDVESAVQKRVVQVMFTVPKEKLRVVNADALSLLSKSDVDHEEEREKEKDIKRMSSVREGDEVENAGLVMPQDEDQSATEKVLVRAEDVDIKQVVLEDQRREDDRLRDADDDDDEKGKGKQKRYIFE